MLIIAGNERKDKMILETYTTFQFIVMCLSYLGLVAAGTGAVAWLFIQIAKEGNF